jgi:Flp pilus assembly protein TadG
MMIGSFWQNKHGNIAIMFGVLLLPLCAAVGLAVDYSRHTSAKQHLQEIVDAASLALASSKEQGRGRLTQMANDFLASNQRDGRLQTIHLRSLNATSEKIDLAADGTIPATFMRLAGYDQLPVAASALAERATRGKVEVSLVLDNTKSMSFDGGGGKTRIVALKAAASQLVSALLKDGNSNVRIALVPYADYVNVGKDLRNASWLNVPADKITKTVIPEKPAVCTTIKTKQVKTTKDPDYPCTDDVDGVIVNKICKGKQHYKDEPITPYEKCSPFVPATTTTTVDTWHGCVGSRVGGKYRLDDAPGVKYPGFVTRHQQCVTPVQRLTNDKAKLLAGISGMVTSLPNYSEPQTFTAAGLIWGLNTLAPDGPFGDGADYKDGKDKTRKVAVLMTDGSNTLLYNKTDGKALSSIKSANQLTASERQPYVAPTTSGNCGRGNDGKDDDSNGNAQGCKKKTLDPVGSGPFKQTNEDSVAICTNMKAKGIEIFTVGFKVDDQVARDMLQACASSDDHFYLAEDADRLSEAFEGISASLQVVRLAR